MSASARSDCTSPPGTGRRPSARPKYTVPVASVVMIGCSRPTTMISPLMKPHSAPTASTATTPSAACSGVPTTRCEARQLASTNTMPTDRSMPEVNTGKVCAIATIASSTPLLAAVVNTGTVQPIECLAMYSAKMTTNMTTAP